LIRELLRLDKPNPHSHAQREAYQAISWAKKAMCYKLVYAKEQPMTYILNAIANEQLLDELHDLIRQERETTARVLAHIAEVDARKLYLEEACSSMFVYCTDRLKLSEAAAYRRITAARAARRFPVIFEMLAEDGLHLTSISMVAAHLSYENHESLLKDVGCKSKKKIETILARWFPKPDVVSKLRAVPLRKPPHSPNSQFENLQQRVDSSAQLQVPAEKSYSVPSKPQQVLKPLAPKRYKLQVTLDQSATDKLKRAQGLLRHRFPNGSFENILDAALDALLEKTEKQRFAVGCIQRKQGAQPGPQRRSSAPSRHIPTAIKRQVLRRDGERCTYRDVEGRRCGETGMLELHHLKPFALGGEHTVDNIVVYCRAHNQHAAELDFGPRHIAPARVEQAKEQSP